MEQPGPRQPTAARTHLGMAFLSLASLAGFLLKRSPKTFDRNTAHAPRLPNAGEDR